ncbi:Carboxylesterase family-domain-containing protein [Geopyxis carbonaria]|nr:Carboxylesterase family-domain-containing protein [Geopyxis carbonaria]
MASPPHTLTPVETLPGIHQFLAIPYARAPTRFAPPQPITGITTSSSTHGRLCPQPAYDLTPLIRTRRPTAAESSFSEDACLHLTITAPAVLPSTPLPVLVYIPGGSLVALAPPPISRITDASSLVLHTPHIHVAISYRVGLLGFLRHPSGANAGFYDQVAALHWVTQHIHAFGGDPREVTLMGESAGAACVHYHILANTPGVKRAVLMSGSAFTIPPQPPAVCDAVAARVAKHLRTTVDGLADVPVDALLDAQTALGIHAMFPSDEFLPHALRPATPAVLTSSLPGHIRAVLIGDCAAEHNLWRKSLLSPTGPISKHTSPSLWPDTDAGRTIAKAYGGDAEGALHFLGDAKFNLWAHRLWGGDGRMWRYAVDAANPWDATEAGRALGAHHVVDLIHLFSGGAGESGQGTAVGAEMKECWGRFVNGVTPWEVSEVGVGGRRAFGGTGERREREWGVLEGLGWEEVDEVVRWVGRGRISFDPGC